MIPANMKSINPWNGELILEYQVLESKDIENKLIKAGAAFKKWRETPIQKRAIYMFDVAEVLNKRKREFAELMTREMGKPLTQSIAEIEKCIWLCHYYLEKGPQFLADKRIQTDATSSYVSYEPLGVILAVMPWNYPFWQVFRFAVPHLVAGNVGVLKHASSVPGCALALEEIFAEAGLPEHTFQTLLIGSENVQEVIENPIVKAVTLTGSDRAGKAVAETAGANVKKTVLELGGNNSCIVLADANLDKYMDTIAWSRFQNAGQSCIAGKRFFIHEDIYDDFMHRFIEKVKGYKIGDPLKEETEIGPMSSVGQAETVERQVSTSVEMGATLLHGGERNKAHYSPTILADVTEEMPAFKEELFGPVAACAKIDSIEEAIELNNNSIYGLGVSIYTEDFSAIEDKLYLIEDGAVFINELVKSDPRLPFGGTKDSGYGRELSEDGIKEFVNRKTVYIR